MHILKIKTEDPYLIDYYNHLTTHYHGDCGVDLITPTDTTAYVNQVTKINLGIQCEFITYGYEESSPFWLVPRSSIVNTPLQLANSIGVIDPEYRGPIIAAVRCFPDTNHSTELGRYIVEKGTKLFQIISPDGKPIKVKVVNELTPTKRGDHGFGSTSR